MENSYFLKILFLEDNLADARLTDILLSEAALFQYELTHVVRMKDALEKIRSNTYDIFLSDLHVPDSNGIETVETIVREAPNQPFIITTGLEDDQLAINAMKMGAQDFIISNHSNNKQLARILLYNHIRIQREVKN